MTKRWILRSLAAPLAMGLSACGQVGGAELPQSECRDPALVSEDQSIRPLAVGTDSFSRKAKVVLNASSADVGAVRYDSSQEIVPRGTEVSVTILERCEGKGQISELFRDRLSRASTPAGVRSFSWRLPHDYSVSELQALAEEDPCLTGVTDSVSSYVSAISARALSDPLSREQRHLEWLEVAEAFREIEVVSGHSSKDVVIAVIDTGIDRNHPDLENVLWVNDREIPENGVDDDGNGYVDDVNGFNFASGTGDPSHVASWPGHEHGSHVAGLAAAEGGNDVGVSGVMPSKARIMALNVFGDLPGASSSDTANAIRYAADNGADVINMSLGGQGRSAVYESAIAYAIEKGVTVISAAGNEGFELSESNFVSPASYSTQFRGMLSVASVDAASGEFSDFSNYGSGHVQLAAPGSEDSYQSLGLLSTWSGGDYERLQGTSMASPIVSGAAAMAIHLLRSRGYSPSPATIEDVLLAAAVSDSRLEDKVEKGRVLNLRKLSRFIKENYPRRAVGSEDSERPDRDAPALSCP
jgi:subtilisin family serine protease